MNKFPINSNKKVLIIFEQCIVVPIPIFIKAGLLGIFSVDTERLI